MARIRSIHPGLFTDEAYMELTIEAPLACILLCGIWCEADDQGVFEWKPLTLKARILPAAGADVAALLERLIRAGFVRRFEAAGRNFGAVRNFCRFQRPKKPHVQHPLPGGLKGFVGLDSDAAFALEPPDDDSSEAGSPPVPHRFPTGGAAPGAAEPPDDGSSEAGSPLVGNRFPTSSPPVPHQFPTGGELSPQMEDGGGNRRGNREGELRARAKPPPAFAGRSTALAPAAEPSEADVAIARDFRLTGPPLEAEWKIFRAHQLSSGARSFNWPEAWRKWLHRKQAFDRKDRPDGAGRRTAFLEAVNRL
jgi:hypothetical protein